MKAKGRLVLGVVLPGLVVLLVSALAQGCGSGAGTAASLPATTALEAPTTSISAPPSVSTSTTAVSSNPERAQPVKAGTPRAWALAASALLTRFNGGRDDLLGMALATPRIVREEKQALVDWWGVNNREDLLAMLQWVEDGGHRKGWDDLATYIGGLSSSELTQFLAKVSTNTELKHQVDMVRHYAPTLGSKSLLGWDYSRYICLCRWGYLCGYLTEAEAWDRIMPVAAMLQKTFSSWAELGQNYLIGREYWSYQQMMKDGDAIRAVYQDLLKSPTSPWKVNSWGMSLGVIAGETAS